MGALHLVLALYGTLALSIPLGKRDDDFGGDFGHASLTADLNVPGPDVSNGGGGSLFNTDYSAFTDPNSGAAAHIASADLPTAPTSPISNDPNSGVAQTASANLPTAPTSPTFQLPPNLNLDSITPVTPINLDSLGQIAPVTPPVTPPVAQAPATPPANPATPDPKVVATVANADINGPIPLDQTPGNTTPNPPDTGSQALIDKLKASKAGTTEDSTQAVSQSPSSSDPQGQNTPDSKTPDKTPHPEEFLSDASSGSDTKVGLLKPDIEPADFKEPVDGLIAQYDKAADAAGTDQANQQTTQQTQAFLNAHPNLVEAANRANGYGYRYPSLSNQISSQAVGTVASVIAQVISAGAGHLINPPVDSVKTQIKYNEAQLDLQNKQAALAKTQAQDDRNQKLIALKSLTAKKIESDIASGEQILKETQALALRPGLTPAQQAKIADALGTQKQQLDSLQKQLTFLNGLTLAEFDIAQQQAAQGTAATGQTPTADQQSATNSGTTGDQQSATNPGTTVDQQSATNPGTTDPGITDPGTTSQQQAALAAQQAALAAQQAQALAAQQGQALPAQQGTPVATRTCYKTCLLSPSSITYRLEETTNVCAQQQCPLGNVGFLLSIFT